MAYVLFIDQSNLVTPTSKAYLGRIDYMAKKIDSITLDTHDVANIYSSARFVHPFKFYYWGQTKNVNAATAFPFMKYMGMVHLYDHQDSFSCNPASQKYNFNTGLYTVALD